MIDGSHIAGKIIFNDNDGIVIVDVGTESRSFTARKFLKFEILETDSTSNHLFYSIEFDDPETGLTDSEIFEVLGELSSFAVLVRIERLKTIGKENVWLPKHIGSGLSQRRDLKVTQTETIYFVGVDGEFESYLKTVKKETDGAFFDLVDFNSSNTKMINASLFKKYTGKYFESLAEFAKANDYSFRRKYDIAKILVEYRRLNSVESIPK